MCLWQKLQILCRYIGPHVFSICHFTSFSRFLRSTLHLLFYLLKKRSKGNKTCRIAVIEIKWLRIEIRGNSCTPLFSVILFFPEEARCHNIKIDCRGGIKDAVVFSNEVCMPGSAHDMVYTAYWRVYIWRSWNSLHMYQRGQISSSDQRRPKIVWLNFNNVTLLLCAGIS